MHARTHARTQRHVLAHRKVCFISVGSKLANHVLQGARLVVKTEANCDDKLKLNKIENNYWNKLEYKVR